MGKANTIDCSKCETEDMCFNPFKGCMVACPTMIPRKGYNMKGEKHGD